ncbi:hypothetical protein [Reyranella sp.]|uniref:hypothetical protein n=1 Tax=Reyranella sp. TaxID=1929291 RepID=UPI002732205F|nr:hypothetical protein [Reyranella sp.]MDP2372433.1 hypothetical protein [Reyranella sp.]
MSLALLTGACGAPLAVSAVSYGSDGALLMATDKTGTDHLVSMVSKKDCALWRAFRGREVCREREEGAKDPYAVDYNEPQRSVSEDGTKYGPPLRATQDAPAASWDSAAYKDAAPAPVPAPAEPVTAVADAAPISEPAAVPAASSPAPKATKAKVARSVKKKPSRGPAAPAP